jgi:hypothetical protein
MMHLKGQLNLNLCLMLYQYCACQVMIGPVHYFILREQ